jgi:hypothetical protein
MVDMALSSSGEGGESSVIEALGTAISFIETLPADCMGLSADVIDFQTGGQGQPYPIRDEWLSNAKAALAAASDANLELRAIELWQKVDQMAALLRRFGEHADCASWDGGPCTCEWAEIRESLGIPHPVNGAA